MKPPARRRSHPLVAVLEQVEPSSCPTRFNFHCHTTCSDGSLDPLALAEQALTMGLEQLAVTDHHSLRAHDPMAVHFEHLRQQGQPVPTLWRGVEISCLLEGCLVHVLGLGFEAEHGSLGPYLQHQAVVGRALRAEAVVTAIHEAGGLAVLAHPARYRLPFKRLIQAAAALDFDGAEAWYDYEQQPRWQPTPLICEAIAAAAHAHGLLQSCGTDTHGLALHGR
ncbi:MAG: PHP domain-containing protein [Cyanobacteriota bacterium]|nr:PHP domain-containing protein [Cyanobacteriota bacterium]